MCIFGDGAVAEGEFHESLNLAALWKLPVLFLCENNLYAMGTHIARYQSKLNIAAKAINYGMPSEVVDGMDVLAVEAATQKAVGYIRSGEGPYFLEIQTYRFRAHSMYDAELYRGKEEVEKWKQRDPIKLLTDRAQAAGLVTEADLQTIEMKVVQEVSQAVTVAESGPWEPVEDLMRDVYTVVKP
jgi:TPP-dependent pyruvate/acetoin dehydrogenase alpha subunit